MSMLQDLYTDFVALLDELENLESSGLYLGFLEVMKQDIELRQANCVNDHMRLEVKDGQH
jgi:hypothetical protein